MAHLFDRSLGVGVQVLVPLSAANRKVTGPMPKALALQSLP
jgi:hypothetical protein